MLVKIQRLKVAFAALAVIFLWAFVKEFLSDEGRIEIVSIWIIKKLFLL